MGAAQTRAPRAALAERAFGELRSLIHEATGVALDDDKQALLLARLGRRVRDLGLDDFEQYVALVRTRRDELERMINAVTTHKTAFFREVHHFAHLREHLRRVRDARGGPRRLRIWSAGCSTGEEPYSIAMTAADVFGGGGEWDVRVLASDIDTDVLRVGEAGVYRRAAADDVPPSLRDAWFEPYEEGDAVRVKGELRRMVSFRQINLVAPNWPIRTRFDAIFCRNVTIYFDHDTQRTLYERLAKHARPRGLFFAGHSENLAWLPDLFTPLGQTTYQVNDGATAAAGASTPPAAPDAGVRQELLDACIRSGELYASRRPFLVRTLLGSCVAVCLHDHDVPVGGMNHFMLPTVSFGRHDAPPSARYGEHALEQLLAKMIALGARPKRIRAKVFGGAHVNGGDCGVPDDNVRFARAWLARNGIPVIAERVGGDQAMLVHFETHTGVARVRLTDAAACEGEG